MDPCTMVTICTLAALSFAAFERMVWYRKETRIKELEVRELEARAQLFGLASRSDLPAYVDRADPMAIEAWRRAQLELGQTSGSRKL